MALSLFPFLQESKTMTITAAMVKELRESTGAGMMDAKKALTETNGDMEAAVDWLRTKGLAKAAKKADRVAAEGLVGVAVEGGKGVAVEINSETDFVAKNAEFQAMVGAITKAALGVADVTALKAAHVDGKPVETVLTDAIAKIGENMTLRRMDVVEGESVAAYVHNAAADGMGKIGVLVALKGADNGIGKQLAMHIAATSPLALNEAALDPAVVERERAVQTQKALEENASSDKPKPEAVIQNNIIPGRMKKFLEENTLVNQKFVMNPDITVAQAASEAGVEILGFIRMGVGEGIEKKEENFAEEVAKMQG
jgi:elongation factor Ts